MGMGSTEGCRVCSYTGYVYEVVGSIDYSRSGLRYVKAEPRQQGFIVGWVILV